MFVFEDYGLLTAVNEIVDMWNDRKKTGTVDKEQVSSIAKKIQDGVNKAHDAGICSDTVDDSDLQILISDLSSMDLVTAKGPMSYAENIALECLDYARNSDLDAHERKTP